MAPKIEQEEPDVQVDKVLIGKCVTCGKEAYFDGNKAEKAYGLICARSGQKHIVESKTYYHPGGRHVQSIRDRRMFSPLIVLRPAYEDRDQVTGRMVQSRGLMVHFSDGKYMTSDPEEQHYLNNWGDVKSGVEGEKMWNTIYLTPEQQLVNTKAELAATERKITEANALLEQVKSQKTGKPAAAVSA